MEKAELNASIRHITIPKSRIRMAGKQEGEGGEEEEHRQLQSVIHFTQTQKYLKNKKTDCQE